MSNNIKDICIILSLLTISFQNKLYGDCFQDVAQRSEAGLIEGFSMGDSWETASPILLSELEICLEVSGQALFVKVLENFAQLKTEKVGTKWEF